MTAAQAQRRSFVSWLLRFAASDPWAVLLVAVAIYALGRAIHG